MNTLSAQNIFSSMTIIQFPVLNPFPVFKRRKKNMEKKSSLIAQLYIFFKKIWLKKRKFQYTKFNIYFIDFFLKNKIFIPINKNIPNRSHFCKDILHQIKPHIIWRRNELYCVLVNEQDTCVLIMSRLTCFSYFGTKEFLRSELAQTHWNRAHTCAAYRSVFRIK